MDDFERRFALKLGNYTLLKINPKKCLHNANDSYLNPLKIYGSTDGLSSFNLKIIEKKIKTFEKFLFLKSVNHDPDPYLDSVPFLFTAYPGSRSGSGPHQNKMDPKH